MEQNVTKMEKLVLEAICNDDIVSDYGWYSSEASFWIGGYWEEEAVEAGVGSKKSIRGVVSSLVKKGLMATNGECGSLTKKCIEMIKANISEWAVPEK